MYETVKGRFFDLLEIITNQEKKPNLNRRKYE